jgi:hypothetical protein
MRNGTLLVVDTIHDGAGIDKVSEGLIPDLIQNEK